MKPLASLLLILALVTPAAAQDMDDAPRGAPVPPDDGKKSAEKPGKAADLGLAGGRYPHVSPDGGQLAFALHGDLWVMPVTGGRATRITLNEANDIKPVWSPDGRRIAFSSDRSGSWDVWTMPADGGVPTRLTWDGGSDSVCEYTPDGASILFQSSRTGAWRIYRISTKGGTPVPVTLERGTSACISKSDGLVYYQRSIADSVRKGYRGTANDEIYRCRPGEAPEQLTENDRSDRYPHVSADGKRLYFLRETGKTGKDYNLHVMDLATKKVEVLTKLDDLGMSYLSLDAACETAYFAWKYRIHSLDLTGKDAKPVLLPVKIVEDTRRETVAERKMTSGANSLDLSRDGSRIVFALAGGIWTMSSGGGDARAITTSGSGDTAPRWSPDGKRIAFYSETRTGNADVFVMNADGSALRQITFSDKGDFFQSWSPDGKSLVYCSTSAGNKDIWVVGLDGSPPVRLTSNAWVEDDPCFSPDGRLIAYDSWQDGNADIFVMNVDGTGVRKIYGTTAQEESPRFSPDGRLLVFSRASSPGTQGVREVVVTDLAGSGKARIGRGSSGVFSSDGREVIYIGSRGRIMAAPAPSDISGGRTISFSATQEKSQKERFAATFDEAWSTVAKNFYDKKYHGVNWTKIKDRYRPLATAAGTRMEFYYYMTEMLGHLNASHQGIRGTISDLPGYGTGLLGCELLPEVIEAEGEEAPSPAMLRLRVTDLSRGGPADKAWIREGDFVFGVGEKRLTVRDNFSQYLENTVGKEVQLLVGTAADGSDVRTVTVKPESFGVQRSREYGQWVANCKKAVKDQGKGKVAYIHIPQMNSRALRNFQSELGRRDTQKAKALVLDVRNNGGGNIHQALIDILSRKHYANNTYRNRSPVKTPSLVWQRPIVLLINERSFSDAEVFPHAFKALKMGTIVGVPTPGAVIGTRDTTLGDGSRFRITMVGFKNLDGTNQEGNGCVPDVIVPMTAEDRIQKRDPQLTKAVEIALSKIVPKRKPAEKPKPEAKPAPEEKPAGK